MRSFLKQIMWVSISGTLFLLLITNSCKSKSASPTHPRLPIIIDTDITMGIHLRDVDDGLAISSIILSKKFNVLGITLTFGNGTLDEVNERALDLLSHLQVSIPIYRGAENKYSLGVTTKASQFIDKSVEKYRGRLLILAIGPLTNLATAYLEDKSIAKGFSKVVIMGGAVTSPGNVPPYMESEFNFWRDPQSAKIVIDNFKHISLFPLDICMDTLIGQEEINAISQCITDWCRYLYNNLKDWYDIMSQVYGGFYPYDLVAAMGLIDPGLVIKKNYFYLSVVTKEGEYYGKSITSKTGKRILVNQDLNSERFKKDFLKYLEINQGD